MAKSVFSNRQLRHVFAAQSQYSGRNHKDSARFEGPLFWSYRTPVALILSDRLALVSSISYSPTTAQHIPSAADLAPRSVYRVPFLPGASGGMYRAPAGGSPRDNVAECHAGNLAYLAQEARATLDSGVRRAKRTGEADRWIDTDSAWEAERYAHQRAKTLAYAAEFGLPAPLPALLDAAEARTLVRLAAMEHAAREADPATSRKREASQRQREARAAWVRDVAGPILAEAGLFLEYGGRYQRDRAREALKGIKSTPEGAAALRDRLAEARERHAADMARGEAERKAREEREAAALAEETARAARYGYSLAKWRAMFGAIWEAEHENTQREIARGADHWREVWRAGGSPVVPSYSAPWDRCPAGGDMLRLKPGAADTLETARRAEVPVSHARRAWRAILATMCSGETWRGEMRVGHFNVTRIDSAWMTAGCHRFHRGELLRVAALLGEPVTCEEISEKESVK